jgi:N-acetylmuramoyl-L-alanine amidase
MRAAMPAVLVEIAFLSNPQEEALLARDGFLTRVAGAVYTGIAQFITYHNQRFK